MNFVLTIVHSFLYRSSFINRIKLEWCLRIGKHTHRRMSNDNLEREHSPAIILASEDGTIYLECLEAWHKGMPRTVIQNSVAGIWAFCWHHLHHPQCLILLIYLRKHTTTISQQCSPMCYVLSHVSPCNILSQHYSSTHCCRITITFFSASMQDTFSQDCLLICCLRITYSVSRCIIAFAWKE